MSQPKINPLFGPKRLSREELDRKLRPLLHPSLQQLQDALCALAKTRTFYAIRIPLKQGGDVEKACARVAEFCGIVQRIYRAYGGNLVLTCLFESKDDLRNLIAACKNNQA